MTSSISKFLSKLRDDRYTWSLKKHQGLPYIILKEKKKLLGLIPYSVRVDELKISFNHMALASVITNSSIRPSDNSIDYNAYKAYAYEGFMENETNTPIDILHACAGMAEEIGEVTGIIKKHIFHGKPLDMVDIKMELGDFQWYYAVFQVLMGIDLHEILTINKAKLDERYKNGRKDLVFRDTVLEYKKVLEVINQE